MVLNMTGCQVPLEWKAGTAEIFSASIRALAGGPGRGSYRKKRKVVFEAAMVQSCPGQIGFSASALNVLGIVHRQTLFNTSFLLSLPI